MIVGFRHLRVLIASIFLFVVVLSPAVTYYVIHTQFRERVVLEEGNRITDQMKRFQQNLDQEFQKLYITLTALADSLEQKDGMSVNATEEENSWSTALREITPREENLYTVLLDKEFNSLGTSKDIETESLFNDLKRTVLGAEGKEQGQEYSMQPDGLALIAYRRFTGKDTDGWLFGIRFFDQKALRLYSNEIGLNISFIKFDSMRSTSNWTIILSSRGTPDYQQRLNSLGRKSSTPFSPLEYTSDQGSNIAIVSPFSLAIEGMQYGFALDLNLDQKMAEIEDLEFTLIGILIAALFLSLLTLVYFNRSVFRPIGLIKDGLKHLSQNRFPPLLPLESKSEIGTLIAQFNSATQSLEKRFHKQRLQMEKLEDQNFALDREVFEKDIERKVAAFTSFESDRKSSISKITDILMDSYGCPYAMIHDVNPNDRSLEALMVKLLEPQTDRILTSRGAVFAENAAVPEVISSGNLMLRQMRKDLESLANEAAKSGAITLADCSNPADEKDKLQILHLPISCDDRLVAVINLVNRTSHYTLNETDEKFLQKLRKEISEILLRAKQNDIVVMDPLTHLFNSRYFEQRLTSEVLRARRNNKPISVLIIEIDDFKSFAERNEDQIAEEVIRSLAALLRGVCRTTDVIARLEKGIFSVILPDTPAEGASVVSEKIRSRTERVVTETKRGPVTVTVSIGCAVFPDQANIPKDLIVLAFDALEAAQELGGNKST